MIAVDCNNTLELFHRSSRLGPQINLIAFYGYQKLTENRTQFYRTAVSYSPTYGVLTTSNGFNEFCMCMEIFFYCYRPFET